MTRIQKWGNSLGVRIPKAIAQHVELQEGTPVKISVAEGRIVIEPQKRTYDLHELLDQITPENLHGEFDWGSPRGREVW